MGDRLRQSDNLPVSKCGESQAVPDLNPYLEKLNLVKLTPFLIKRVKFSASPKSGILDGKQNSKEHEKSRVGTCPTSWIS